MKQKLRRFMAGFLAILTMFTTLFTNGTTAFAASSSANIAFWVASSKDHGVISEFNSKHTGSILYAMIDGHSAYCMNFGLSAKGGQLMNSDSNPNTNLSAAQEKLLAYCMYYGYSTTEAKAPTNDQRNKFIATQSMVWIIVNGIFGTGSADSAASKLCACAPDSSSSYSYYETLRDTEMIRSLTEAVQSHTGNYEAIEKMLKQMETIRLDEAVAKNLTSLNEKLEKENREFTEQLEGKQNEVNKGLQTIAQLRTELENLKKEMKIMQDRNTDLEQQISQRDETIREQGQAIIAKNSTIEKYKSAEEKAADEQHHGRTDLQEETVEKQSEIEMKENYDSQAVGQTQGAIPKQAATIPAGAIPVYANAGGIPVYYTMTLVQDQKVLQRTDVDYMHRKPSVFEGIMSKFAFKKKSHKDLVQLVINKELSPEQVNAIRGGLESGLDEEQLELIINKNLTPEKMQSIIRFAALQNSLKAERGGV